MTLEDDAFVAAQICARARALKLGQAESEMFHLGSAGRLPVRQDGSLWVFDLPANTPQVSAQRVKILLDDAL